MSDERERQRPGGATPDESEAAGDPRRSAGSEAEASVLHDEQLSALHDEQPSALHDEQLSAFHDEQLSAFLDGELADAEAEIVRDALARDPRLAERVARFEAVDAELFDLPATPVSADLGERLRARLDGAGASTTAPVGVRAPATAAGLTPDAESVGEVRAAPGFPNRRGTRTPRRSRPRWLVPAAAAAAAAALALVFLAQRDGPRGLGGAFEERLAAPSAPVRVVETPAPGALLAEASDEELAIALDYELLVDLEVIDELEILELLVDLQGSESS